ncbi:MAG: sugar transferase [Sulfuricurvum sp.]|uniref:sugar transferase n=1 Tax=Sulfuricurvum sp. TaxID=2025608 RepID=UPI00262C27FD|nr:sugar transferase [Sulfuricurvum sp.]MDD2367836.1 sugar transferase [Sulfuricurvum sp.]MDD2949203.1 sugar transferase [Sulfuricurvum sp.]MDD5117206.1 sugar transferase [Sulfuricurvum sp.]
MTLRQRFLKRVFDIVASLCGLILVWWLIVIAFIIATIETRSNGFFVQKRVGKDGRLFSLFKIKTMHQSKTLTTTITTADDPRITVSGALFRRTKIDELPQLINVLIGDMSLVGPRPDVPGYADKLSGDNTSILTLRPGITGPATLKYKNEEALLAAQKDPKQYNNEIIWPDKVRINRQYLEEWTFWTDLIYLWRTLSK